MPPVDYLTYSADYLPDPLDGKSTYTANVRELTQRLVALENENARLTAKNQAFLSDMQALDTQMDRATLEADNTHLHSQLSLLERHNAELMERLAGIEMNYQGKLAEAYSGADLTRMKETELRGLVARNEMLLKQKDAQIKALEQKYAQVNRDLEINNQRLTARERDLTQTRSAEALNRDQLLRRNGLLERHVEQRTSELQSAVQRSMTMEAELRAVRTWWKKKNSGLCGSSEHEPWKQSPYMQPIPPVPAPPALPQLPAAPTVVATRSAPMASAPPATTSGRSTPTGGMGGSTGAAAGGSAATAPYIGMVVKQNPGTSMVFVSSLDGGAPAATGGLQAQDQIISFGGMPTASIGQFRAALKANAQVGRKVPVVVAGAMGTQPSRTHTLTIGARSRQVVTSAPQLKTKADVDATLRDRAKLQDFTIAAFNICDADGSGVVSREELATGMRRVLPPEMSRYLTDTQLHDAFVKGDVDKSNFLVAGEFLPVMENLLSSLSRSSR